MRESGDSVRFTMAEVTGLQTQLLLEERDRHSERYVFDSHCMFNSEGKKLSPVDCVFFPTLSMKKDALALLKPIRFVLIICKLLARTAKLPPS